MIFSKFRELGNRHHNPVLEHFPDLKKDASGPFTGILGAPFAPLCPLPWALLLSQGRGRTRPADPLRCPSQLATAVVSGTSVNSLAVASLNLGGFWSCLFQGSPRYLQSLPWWLHLEPPTWDAYGDRDTLCSPSLSKVHLHLDEETVGEEQRAGVSVATTGSSSGPTASPALRSMPTAARERVVGGEVASVASPDSRGCTVIFARSCFGFR